MNLSSLASVLRRTATVALGALAPGVAFAQAQIATPPAPYSAPFALRPVMPANALRLDSSIATGSTAAGDTAALVQFLTASARVAQHVAVNVKLGWVDLARAPTQTGSAVSDVALGAVVADQSSDFRYAGTFVLGLPVGSGGGDAPTVGAKAAIGSGPLARAGMDTSMFAVNDFTFTVGGDVAYVAHGFIAQGEATLIQAVRVRGATTQKDATRTNSTFGLALGYFVLPQLTAGAELRYQRFLSTPSAVAADPTGASRDNLSAAVTARAHLKVGKVVLHPGASVGFGLDAPLSDRSARFYQLDLLMNL